MAVGGGGRTTSVSDERRTESVAEDRPVVRTTKGGDRKEASQRGGRIQ